VAIDRENLDSAYRNTDYVVLLDEGELVVHIDEPAPALMSLLAQQHTMSAAFLTAANPHSNPTDDAANAAAHDELLAALSGHPRLDTEHRDPQGRWPVERGVLVLGTTLDEACSVGRRFRQNAVVFVADDTVPQLIWLD